MPDNFIFHEVGYEVGRVESENTGNRVVIKRIWKRLYAKAREYWPEEARDRGFVAVAVSFLPLPSPQGFVAILLVAVQKAACSTDASL